jgi:hypothetical protein
MAQGLLVLKTRISEGYGMQAAHNFYAMKPVSEGDGL